MTLLTWMNETCEEFIRVTSLSKSKHTVDAYKGDLRSFFEFIKNKGIKRLKTLKTDHIIHYLGDMKMQGKSESTVARHFTSIRCYCKFLKKNKYLVEDLSEDITKPAVRQKAPRIPNVKQVETMLQQPDLSKETGVRDRAILELLYSSGLRASELVDLELHHVGETSVVVSCGKRGKTRTVPLTDEAVNWIKRYLEIRGDEQGYFFITELGRRMTRQLLNKIVCRYAKHAGLNDVSTHTLRHACATHLLDAGADLRLIQEVLGHASIATTERYTHLSSNTIHSMFQKFHPRKGTKEDITV